MMEEFEFRVAPMEELMKPLTYLRFATCSVNLTQGFPSSPLKVKGVVHSYVSRVVEMGYASHRIEMFLRGLWL